MPIHKVDGGYKWGGHGKVYPTREEAEKQAAAAYAHGYTGDKTPASEAQRRAMYAAAEGRSNLGIPKSVGEEFVGDCSWGASDNKIKGAGVCMIAPSGRMLFIKRSPNMNHPNEWDFPGGKADEYETPLMTAKRETMEEIGAWPYGELEPMGHVSDKHDVEFITYKMYVRHEFAPKLEKEEHTEYVWAKPEDAPKPLHPGIVALLTEDGPQHAKDYTIHGEGTAKEYVGAVPNTKVSNETVENTKVHASAPNYAKAGSTATGGQAAPGVNRAAQDSRLAQDRAINFARSLHRLAFDRASVRTMDKDGRMHVEITNISKATVNPYYGYEIPGAEELGLDLDRIYMLLRDPDELAKAAPTSNNIQLLDRHDPVSAEDTKKDIVVGSTGTDAVFEAPFLRNSLVVWDAAAIRQIESGEKQELSCAYRYVPDMVSGTYEGMAYDGVMREICFNHVALVKRGRAGPDVVVGDSSETLGNNFPMENKPMSKSLSKKAALAKGVLLAVLKPKLAADSMPNLDGILAGVTKKNWLIKKPGIIAAIKPMLAADADLETLVELLDELDGSEPADNDLSMDKDDSEKAIAEVLDDLRGKISDEDLKMVEEKLRAMSVPVAHIAPEAAAGAESKTAEDQPPEFAGEPKPGGEMVDKKKEEKPAMDAAAVARAVKLAEDKAVARVHAIAEAKEIVKPYVGELAIACDSAEGVFKAALKVLGVKTKGIHPSAYRSVLEAQPKPGAQARSTIAQDSSKPTAYVKFCEELGLKH